MKKACLNNFPSGTGIPSCPFSFLQKEHCVVSEVESCRADIVRRVSPDSVLSFFSGDHADGHPVSSRHLHPRNLRAGFSALPFQIEVDANRGLSADVGFDGLYRLLDHELRGHQLPHGAETDLDMAIAMVGVLIGIELARRVVGNVFVILGIPMLLYGVYGYLAPDLISHAGATFPELCTSIFYKIDGGVRDQGQCACHLCPALRPLWRVSGKNAGPSVFSLIFHWPR